MPTVARNKKASADRRAELKILLLELSARLTKAKTLTSLAKMLNRSPKILSDWIHVGEVPPYVAVNILKLENTNPKGKRKIALKDLNPSLTV